MYKIVDIKKEKEVDIDYLDDMDLKETIIVGIAKNGYGDKDMLILTKSYFNSDIYVWLALFNSTLNGNCYDGIGELHTIKEACQLGFIKDIHILENELELAEFIQKFYKN